MKDKITIDAEILALGSKRKELILKVLGQLYKGQVGTLHFKNGSIFKIDYYVNYNSEEKRRFNPFGDFEGLKKELLKNLHDISEKFNEENLSILEFLMDKMDWDMKLGISSKTDKRFLQKFKEDIRKDIQEIKDRCANYLLIMAIEESEK
jgi:hypothetical protein